MPESQRYALVKDGKTINFIAWDGETPYNPPDKCEVIIAEKAPPMEVPPEEK